MKSRQSYLSEIVNKLSIMQLTAWIQYTIDQDFSVILNNKDTNQFSSLDNQSKWCIGSMYDLWQQLFLKSLESINIDSMIKILSSTPPFPREISNANKNEVNAHWQQHSQWWDDLFFELINRNDFRKQS